MTRATYSGSEATAERQRRIECGPTFTAAPQLRELDLDGDIARERTEALLDEALDETFPASDPVSITPPKHA
ncbi:MAG: hypothetical protein ABI304_04485 [Rudaea sp.]